MGVNRTQTAYHVCYQLLSVILGPFLNKNVWFGRKRTIKDFPRQKANYKEQERERKKFKNKAVKLLKTQARCPESDKTIPISDT